MTGKGDTPRPLSVTDAEYAANYARTFSRQIDDPSGYDTREKVCPPSDPVERLRRENLAHAEAVILKLPDQPPCHDWPARDPLTHPDHED
jgi:hypothetical protein